MKTTNLIRGYGGGKGEGRTNEQKYFQKDVIALFCFLGAMQEKHRSNSKFGSDGDCSQLHF